MNDKDYQSRNARGSSPPFQELERWIEDGADGSHWVRMLSAGSHEPEGRGWEPLDLESPALLQVDDERRWEDDGGNGTRAAGQAG